MFCLLELVGQILFVGLNTSAGALRLSGEGSGKLYPGTTFSQQMMWKQSAHCLAGEEGGLEGFLQNETSPIELWGRLHAAFCWKAGFLSV